MAVLSSSPSSSPSSNPTVHPFNGYERVVSGNSGECADRKQNTYSWAGFQNIASAEECASRCEPRQQRLRRLGDGRNLVTSITTNLELREAMMQYLDPTTQPSAIVAYGPIANWDVSAVEDFSKLFIDDSNQPLPGAHAFNDDISGWDVSSGTSFLAMFKSASSFNREISNWDVSSGTDFRAVFSLASAFNQDISNWDVSSSVSFLSMFHFATVFNVDISDWNVSGSAAFQNMFNSANAFNQDISKWDVSSATIFNHMFYQASAFNQNLCSWGAHYSLDNTYNGMFNGSGCSNVSYPTEAGGTWCKPCVPTPKPTVSSNATFLLNI